MSRQNAKKILHRVKEALGVSTDAELAARLGVVHGTIGSWKSRDTLDYKLLIDATLEAGANLHWLFTGVGPPTSQVMTDVHEYFTRTNARLERLERLYEELSGK